MTPLTVDFNGDADGHTYSDGSWQYRNGRLVAAEARASGKRLYGDGNWGDYTVEVSVTPLEAPNCGLLVRATNPGAPNFMNDAATDSDAATGTDWLEGYFVGLTEDAVILGKQSYGYTELARSEGCFPTGETYRLKVICLGARIRVFVDGELYLDYTDPEPYAQGMVGIRCCRSSAAFEDLTVSRVE